MPEPTLNDYQIHAICVEIESGKGCHSPFVRDFAHMMAHADITNRTILRTAALRIIDKYHLRGYIQQARTVLPAHDDNASAESDNDNRKNL